MKYPSMKLKQTNKLRLSSNGKENGDSINDLNYFSYCNKIPESINLKEGKVYIVIVHGHLALLPWVCGGTVHHGGEHEMEQVVHIMADRK